MGPEVRLKALAIALLLLVAPAAASAALPEEGRCPDWTEVPGLPLPEDAGGAIVASGDELGAHERLKLARLLPPEVWNARHAFFPDGLVLTVGPCHRRYAATAPWLAATEKHRGSARLTEEGGLEGYVAGLPFPSAADELEHEHAGLRIAWNLAHRHRGAGPAGRFRLFDRPFGATARFADAQVVVGSFFWLRTAHRADLADADYRVPEGRGSSWVAGGRIDEPTAARNLAWRQRRDRESATDWKRSDDTRLYLPELRKVKRVASSWSDGLFLPRYRAAGQSGSGSAPFSMGGQVGAVPLGPGGSAGVADDIGLGFTGLSLRPNAWTWKVVGLRDVLAPLNGKTPGWPLDPNRNYGPLGLSLAGDVWDVRRAVVIEGRARRPRDGRARRTLWVDLQTHQPLYVVDRRADGGLLDTGILAHRYSGDLPHYPLDASQEIARVFDPVAAAFFGGRSGWLRESFDVESGARAPGERRRMTSTDSLERGR